MSSKNNNGSSQPEWWVRLNRAAGPLHPAVKPAIEMAVIGAVGYAVIVYLIPALLWTVWQVVKILVITGGIIAALNWENQRVGRLNRLQQCNGERLLSSVWWCLFAAIIALVAEWVWTNGRIPTDWEYYGFTAVQLLFYSAFLACLFHALEKLVAEARAEVQASAAPPVILPTSLEEVRMGPVIDGTVEKTSRQR